QQDEVFEWGDEPINPRIPWNQEIQACVNNFCDLCSAGYCSKNSHVAWGWIRNWDWNIVQFKLEVDRQINSLKCERCSSRFKRINHYKGDRCPYEWNYNWWKS
ncbi:17415_t:CDS:2, partial [Cetraspora pellucida]